jgi:hypothetical protein
MYDNRRELRLPPHCNMDAFVDAAHALIITTQLFEGETLIEPAFRILGIAFERAVVASDRIIVPPHRIKSIGLAVPCLCLGMACCAFQGPVIELQGFADLALTHHFIPIFHPDISIICAAAYDPVAVGCCHFPHLAKEVIPFGHLPMADPR